MAKKSTIQKIKKGHHSHKPMKETKNGYKYKHKKRPTHKQDIKTAVFYKIQA